jgi:hypothetical protein
LGFDVPTSAVCTGCAAQIAISPQADCFVAVAAELARAEQWAQAGRAGAADGDWSWLRFARWRARQPLQGNQWDAAIKAVRGEKWAASALALRGAIARQHEQAQAVIRLLVGHIRDNPGRSALLERAIRMVETDSGALDESATVLRISGCRTSANDAFADIYGRMSEIYKQPSPWHLVAGAWRAAKKRGVHVEIDRLAEYLDEQFPHVHDLEALHCCALHDPPYEAGDCVHTWAVRTAQAYRRSLIAQWVERLDMAASGLDATHLDATGVCTHLLCVPSWPLTADSMDAIAYLSQFEVVCGPHKLGQGYYTDHAVVVLRVPDWAAAHAAELRAPLSSEADRGESMQAVRLARTAGVPIVGDEFTPGRRKPSTLVTAARQQMLDETSVHGYAPHRRVLAPGSTPPSTYGQGDEWTPYSARYVLDGATFIYGFDDMDLLRLAMPEDRRSRVQAVAQVELQTGCRHPYHPDCPHICDVDGIVEAVNKSGALVFTADGMRDPVTIPSAYVAGLVFSR